jgi:hypothetical protein
LKNEILEFCKLAKLDLESKNHLIQLIDKVFPQKESFCKNWNEFSDFLSNPWRYILALQLTW